MQQDNKEITEAFARLARSPDILTIINYYKVKIGEMCDVRNIQEENIDQAIKAANFLEEEFINKFNIHIGNIRQRDIGDENYF